MIDVIDFYAENPIVGKTLRSCFLENNNVYDDINGNGDSDWTIYNSTTLNIGSGTVNINGVNSNINWGWGVPPGIYAPGNSVKIGAENIYLGNPNNTNGNSVNFLSTNQIKIPGGASGQVLSTDGAGNLSWTTPSSGGLTASSFVFNEIPLPTAIVNNFTIAFTPVVNTVQVFINGLLQKPTTDYTVSGTTITFINFPLLTDEILCHYIKS